MKPSYPNLTVLPQTDALLSAMTYLRDESTSREDFIFHSDRVIRFLIEAALNLLPFVENTVSTSTDAEYIGLAALGKICGISIMRAGESMELALRECCRSIRIGKILIQRDENTALANLYYSKLPPDVANRTCLLLDPMLATGGSAIKAIELLIEHQVPEVCCPEGLQKIFETYPNISIVTAAVDEKLDDKKYILPGLGDFGCRYFGTDV
ncbi:Uracil phosphoribosyltransferase, synthesizes UMP from uracil [Globomyces sp. JEL0801]|nr:Uracil phosphoribosyltransferase, synthesizes UMP from uracil [Globomyces sp. JEL0801]